MLEAAVHEGKLAEDASFVTKLDALGASVTTVRVAGEVALAPCGALVSSGCRRDHFFFALNLTLKLTVED